MRKLRCFPFGVSGNSWIFWRVSWAVVLLMVVGAAELPAQDLMESLGPRFAPGVLTTIAPALEHQDTVTVRDIVELRARDDLARPPFKNTSSRTLYEMAQAVDFRRDLWCLEFSFKPLRMLYVDVPQSTGKMQRKLIWYVVYRVRNTGIGLGPAVQPDGTFKTVERESKLLQFVPQFLLTSQDRDRDGKPVRKTYLDRIIPSAIDPIARRELPRGTLLNSVQITEAKLVPTGAAGGVWGVATWSDVDPEIDFFSILVGGLTNAYQWQDPPGAYQPGVAPGSGRRLRHKQLQLNFWRPGDAYAEDEREIRWGPAPGKAAYYGAGEGVAYQWIYR